MSSAIARKMEIKETLKRLRQERAEHLKAVQARLKETTSLRNKIRKAFNDGPRTIPSLAESVGEKTDRILWLVMEMRNYGLVAEDEQDGDYYKYRLVAADRKEA